MAENGLFIDVVIWTVYVLLTAAVAMAGWSAVHGVLTHERSTDMLASRHTSWIGYTTAGVVAVILAVTFLFASTKPLVVNGRLFTDTLWLRLTDMFIFTSTLLVCICSVVIVVAKFRR